MVRKMMRLLIFLNVLLLMIKNVENDLDQDLIEAHNEELEDIEQFDEISNFCDGSDSEF